MSLVISLLIVAAVIYVVDMLMSDMSVGGYLGCIKVAVVHAVLSFVLFAIIPAAETLAKPFAALGSSALQIATTVVTFLIAGLSLFLCDKFLSDFRLGGFKSAVVAAVLISVVRWLFLAVLGI